MRKRLMILMMVVGLVVMSAGIAFAETVPSLDEVTGEYTETVTDSSTNTDTSTNNNVAPATNQATTPTTDNNTTSVTTENGSNSFMNDLAQAGKMDTSNPQAAAVGQGIQKWVGIVIQVLGYVAVGAMSLRVALDTLYIVAPFLRSIMSNGFMGNPMAGSPDNMGGGMGMSGMGGMGGYGSGMGMGGYGGGYGGRYGSRYGGGYGMGGGMMGGMMGQSAMNNMGQQQQLANGMFQLVSNAALNAVASESTVGVDGNGARHPYRMYLKDMLAIFILTPVIFALAYSGVLLQLGFAIGGMLNVLIAKIATGGII